MTDATPADTTGAAAQPLQPTQPGFRLPAQYARALASEHPRAPDSLRIEGKPQIDMGVELNASGRPDGLFEVDLKLSIKASTETTPVFHVELLYGGLFQLQGVADQDIEAMLLIECPRYLFPYAREIVAGATADGGFYPPFMLDPIDFAGIYAARMQQAAQAPGAA